MNITTPDLINGPNCNGAEWACENLTSGGRCRLYDKILGLDWDASQLSGWVHLRLDVCKETKAK